MKGPLLGYVPDAPDPRDLSIHDSPLLGLAPTITSESVDLRPYLDAVQTQIGNSCVGHSIASAAFLTAAIAREPIARPSALFPYTMARLLSRQAKIADVGCSPRDAMLGIKAYGLIAQERWPEVEAFMNAVPPLDAFEEGDAARIEAFYRIPDGSGAADAAKLALKRGLTPIFGMVVDQAWEDLGSGIYTAPSGTVLGGHMQTLIGFEPMLDAFRVLNHWGTGWAEEGFGWIGASFFETGTFDKWTISVVPPEVA